MSDTREEQIKKIREAFNKKHHEDAPSKQLKREKLKAPSMRGIVIPEPFMREIAEKAAQMMMDNSIVKAKDSLEDARKELDSCDGSDKSHRQYLIKKVRSWEDAVFKAGVKSWKREQFATVDMVIAYMALEGMHGSGWVQGDGGIGDIIDVLMSYNRQRLYSLEQLRLKLAMSRNAILDRVKLQITKPIYMEGVPFRLFKLEDISSTADRKSARETMRAAREAKKE